MLPIELGTPFTQPVPSRDAFGSSADLKERFRVQSHRVAAQPPEDEPGMTRSPDHPAPSSPGGDTRPTARAGRRPSRLPRLAASLALLLVTVGGLIGWWDWSRIHVRTDNAYVVGNITPVSSQVSGMVVALYTDDNMIVEAGDALAQIDPVPWQLAVDQALADLRQLRAQERAADVGVRLIREERKAFLEGAQAKLAEADRAVGATGVEVQSRRRIHEKEQELLASTRAQLPGLVARQENARDYFARFSRLAASGDIPEQDRDNREATYREAISKVESLRNEIAAAERQVLSSELQLEESAVRLEQSQRAGDSARAAVGQARPSNSSPTSGSPISRPSGVKCSRPRRSCARRGSTSAIA